MEEAIESLFNEGGGKDENPDQAAAQEEDNSSEKEEWMTQRSSRHRAQRTGELANWSSFMSLSAPRSGSSAKP